MINIILKTLLVIHIICGFTALVAGLLAMIYRKGGKQHKLSGKIYFYAMMGVAATALIIAIAKGLSFLMMIGLFSFFLAFSGYRTVILKVKNYTWIDYTVLALGFITGLFMMASLEIRLMVFGGILLFNIVGDLRLYVFNKDKKVRAKMYVIAHIGKMMGAYIATVTAFVVTNVHTNNPVVIWLMPTVLGVPFIIYHTRKYKARTGKARATAAA